MRFGKVEIFVSTVTDGNMSEKWGEIEIVTKKRNKFLEKNKIKFEDCAKMSLLSGTNINEVNKIDMGKWIEADGVITSENNLPIWLLVGDCFPVVFWNESEMGVAHVGWRGMEGNLIKKMVEKMGKNLQVWIGPGIRDKDYWWEDSLKTRKIRLDKYILQQLIDCGVKNIIDCGIDTVADLNYFSHHRTRSTHEVEGRFAIAARYCADSSR